MTQEEILPQLEEWAAHHERLRVQIEALQAITRADCECPLLDAIYRMQDAYTRAVGGLVGDSAEWLEWFSLECEMGRKPKDVRTKHDGPWRKVKTLKQLAKVIAE